MSQVAISGNASGTGTLTIAAPNTNSNYTLTLPAATGTVASIASVNNNGVVYANSSGQPTTDTAFVFDGTNVGIGTSSPSAKFVVAGGGAAIQGNGFPSTGSGWELYTDNSTGTGSNGSWLQSYSRTSSAWMQANYNALAHIFSTSGAERMRIDSSGNLLVNTTTAQTGAKLAVTGGIQGTIQSGTAVNSTSGTSISFTSIPSWVKRITVQLNGVSTNGTSFLIIQLGTGATPTYTTTGYVSGSNSTTTTVGLLAHSGGSAADVRLGSCVLTNFGNNIWNSSASGGFSNGAGTSTAGGYISLGATLTAIRLTTVNGTDAFDAGSINILYEG